MLSSQNLLLITVLDKFFGHIDEGTLFLEKTEEVKKVP